MTILLNSQKIYKKRFFVSEFCQDLGIPVSKPSFYAISVTYSIRFFASAQNDIRKLISFQCCKSLIYLFVHACILSQLFFFLIKLSFGSLVNEVRIRKHAVYTL